MEREGKGRGAVLYHWNVPARRAALKVIVKDNLVIDNGDEEGRGCSVVVERDTSDGSLQLGGRFGTHAVDFLGDVGAAQEGAGPFEAGEALLPDPTARGCGA
jgi:hypothetical protein